MPESVLANAIITNNTLFNLLRVLGPSFAGALIAFPAIGVAGEYDVMVVSYFLAMIALGRLISLTISPKRVRISVDVVVQDDIDYMCNSRVLSTMILIGAAFVLFGMPI